MSTCCAAWAALASCCPPGPQPALGRHLRVLDSGFPRVIAIPCLAAVPGLRLAIHMLYNMLVLSCSKLCDSTGIVCRSQDKARAKYTLLHTIRSMHATPEVRRPERDHSWTCLTRGPRRSLGIWQ